MGVGLGVAYAFKLVLTMGIQPDILYQGTTSVVPKAAYEQNGFSRCKQCAGAKALIYFARRSARLKSCPDTRLTRRAEFLPGSEQQIPRSSTPSRANAALAGDPGFARDDNSRFARDDNSRFARDDTSRLG